MKKQDRGVISDTKLRRALCAMSMMTLLLPPFLGGAILVMAGIYPYPEFFMAFLHYAGLYVLAVLLPLAWVTRRIASRIINIPLLENDGINREATRFLKPFPWYLLLFLLLYTLGGDVVTNLSLEQMGVHHYIRQGYIFSLLGVLSAVLVSVFPIYFFFTSYIGRYLAPRGVHVEAAPMSTNIVMLGLVAPVLIGSMLILYFYNKTRYLAPDTLMIWAVLVVIAAIGTYIVLRNYRQGIQPLADYYDSDGAIARLEEGQLVSQSLDEVGVLTARLKAQIENVLALKEKLKTNQFLNESLLRLSRSLELSRTYGDIAESLRGELEKVTPYQETWMLLAEDDDRYFRIAAVAGKNIEPTALRLQRLDMFSDPFLRDLHQADEPVVVEDMRTDPRTDKNLVEVAGHRTTIHVPVVIAGKRIGLFGTGSFASDGVMPPAVEIIDYLQASANHVAAAVDRVRFIEERESIALEREQEQKFSNAVIENAGALVVVLDSTGKIQRFNRACETITGYRFEELKGRYVWDYLLEPEERDAVKKYAFEALAHNPEKLHGSYTNYWVTRNGEKRLIEWSNTVLMDRQGSAEFVISLGIDITDKRAAEEGLQRSKETYSRAEEIAHIGSWDWNILTNDLHWTDEIYRIFGKTPQSFAATYPAFLESIYPDDREMVIEAVNASVADPDVPYSIEHRVLRTDGTIRYVFERGRVYYNDAGKPVRMIGTVHDITDRKLADQELRLYRDHLEELVKERTAELQQAKELAETANRAKSEFLSRMSHELRTPMNAILGFSQVLELEELDEMQMDFVQEIHRAGNHLFELISELLDLSRIEAGRMATVLRPQGMNGIVEHAINLVKNSVDEKGLTLVNRCNEEINVFTDETRLKQILVNFLSNAVKYNREQGGITLDCERIPGNKLRIRVLDTGIGIAPEKLNDLYKPFERLGAEYTGVDGTGIGLALSKKLAELMGAELGVQSTPGEGSTFWIDVPIAEISGHKGISGSDAREIHDRDAKTVLYIEDNPANLKVVESMFKHLPQLQLISTFNGESGLDLAERYRPDVILLDIHLPGMDGFQVLGELKKKKETCHVPVIALTADAMPLDIERGLQAGFHSYVTKPVKINELLAAIDAVVGAKSAVQN